MKEDYIFQKDENDNILSQQIFFNGFIWNKYKNEDDISFSKQISKNAPLKSAI